MRSLAFVLLGALALAPRLAGQSQDPAALAARIQARYATIKDFQGDFVQSYEGGVLRTKTSESGTLAVKQPGLFRFVYAKPERKEFVSDGTQIYTYLVADKQVIVSPAPGPGEATTPALFLAGRANIARDFTPTATTLPSAPPGLIALKLEPRKPDPDYQWFALGVDPATLQIRHLVAMDRQGGRSAFTFSNLKENQGISDNTFRFRIPRGVDVVNNGPRQP
ncbi:MAG TPA: outer membrane lipoprotein carrier protein LolA [Vicinamibacterales bacterium]|nr:outer membrane lipoprotein carrier protein LolA [Vicinamibacterales bacterium]